MNKILDNNYYDLIMGNTIISGYDTGDNITPLSDRYSLLHIPIASPDPCDLGTYPYNSFPVFRNQIFIWGSVICCQFHRKRQNPWQLPDSGFPALSQEIHMAARREPVLLLLMLPALQP